MLLHEKMRLQRKINKLTLKQLHMGNIQERMQKKVDRREKYYAKLEKQLERQANAYKNSANMYFSNMFGLGTNSVNLGNYGGFSQAAMQILQQWNGTNPYASDQASASYNKTLVEAIINGTLEQDGTNKAYRIGNSGSYDYTEQDVAAANRIIQLANSAVTQQQTYASQMKSNYENQVSIWLEAQQEQLEAQKEWEMDLLAEEQEDMEAEKTSIETQLSLAEERKKAIEEKLGQSIQDAAPKFGLA